MGEMCASVKRVMRCQMRALGPWAHVWEHFKRATVEHTCGLLVTFNSTIRGFRSSTAVRARRRSRAPVRPLVHGFAPRDYTDFPGTIDLRGEGVLLHFAFSPSTLTLGLGVVCENTPLVGGPWGLVWCV